MKNIAIGKCINNSNYRFDLTIGKIYKLNRLSEYSELVSFIGDKGKLCSVFQRRFVKILHFTKIKII